MPFSRRMIALALSLGAICGLSTTSMAQDAKSAPDKGPAIAIELNAVEPLENICRVKFMMKNGLSQEVSDMGLEVVILDKEGLARSFLLLRSGRLPSGKRRVKQFDLPDFSCTDMGELLINDVADCKGEGLTPAVCLDKLTASSRSAIKLGL